MRKCSDPVPDPAMIDRGSGISGRAGLPAFRAAGNGWRRPSTRWPSAAAWSRSRSATSRRSGFPCDPDARSRELPRPDRRGARSRRPRRRGPDRRLVQRARSPRSLPPASPSACAGWCWCRRCRRTGQPDRAGTLLPAGAAAAEPAVSAATRRRARCRRSARRFRSCVGSACGSSPASDAASRVPSLSPTRMAARIQWIEAYRFSDPSTISQPVLVITGEDGLDRVVLPALTRRYLRRLPARAARRASAHRPPRTADQAAEFAELVQRVSLNEIGE